MLPPIFDTNFPKPSIIQYTAVPPFLTSAKDIIAGVQKTVEVFTNQPNVSIVKKPEDLQTSGIGVVLGLQQPPLDATQEDWIKLKGLGIHLTTLSYKDNESPYGAGFLNDGPLTDAGKKLIRMLSASNIWLDLSHSGHTTARDVIEYVTENNINIKIVASHTGSYSIYANKRNLPDDVLQGIARLGGIIGVYTLSFGLDIADDTLIPFYNHIQKIVSLCGSEHVVLGTDGVYEYLDNDFVLSQFAIMKQKFDSDGRMMSRHPVESPELNLVRKDIVIKDLFSSQLMSDQQIKNIMSENGVRFLEKNL